MKLKKITENGTEYFVIEDDEKVTENSEKSQKRDTGWHMFGEKLKNSLSFEALSDKARAFGGACVGVARIGVNKATESIGRLTDSAGRIRAEREKAKRDDESLARLISLLPYASGECTAEIVERIKAYPEALARCDTHTLLSKLDGKMRDEIFLFIVSHSRDSSILASLAPLVSSEAISKALKLIEP